MPFSHEPILQLRVCLEYFMGQEVTCYMNECPFLHCIFAICHDFMNLKYLCFINQTFIKVTISMSKD